MTDLQLAKTSLSGHSLCLCKDGNLIFSDKRGISPLMDFIAENRDLSGYSAADIVVGKAAAFLMIKCGIKEVYARVISQAAASIFTQYAVPFSFDTITEKIINREGTDICPMEKTVMDIKLPDVAYEKLKEKLKPAL